MTTVSLESAFRVAPSYHVLVLTEAPRWNLLPIALWQQQSLLHRSPANPSLRRQTCV